MTPPYAKYVTRVRPPLCTLVPPRGVEIVVLMPILFDNSMLSFSQYELKSSEAIAFPWLNFKVMGTIARQLKALSQNTPQSSIIL